MYMYLYLFIDAETIMHGSLQPIALSEEIGHNMIAKKESMGPHHAVHPITRHTHTLESSHVVQPNFVQTHSPLSLALSMLLLGLLSVAQTPS